MRTASQSPTAVALTWRHRAGAYYELCKPRVVMLMVFTAIVGELLADPRGLPLNALVFGNLGIAMCAGAAAAINHILDREIDARMLRTRRRPLPRGRITTANALAFAALLGAAGLALLWFVVNPLTAALTFASLMGYAVIYTGFLKRATSQNIVIGGLAGAAPPLLGWTAVTGQVSMMPLLLLLIVFVWTPPHFWPLAIQRRDDYAEVDMPMLPVTHGDTYTRWQILFYTALLVATTTLPFIFGLSGPLYLFGALALGGRFLWHAVNLLMAGTRARPISVFHFSITYLMLLFVAFLADSYLMALLGTQMV